MHKRIFIAFIVTCIFASLLVTVSADTTQRQEPTVIIKPIYIPIYIPQPTVPETEPEETEPPVTETEPPVPETTWDDRLFYYDVPLDENLQDYIFTQCYDYGVDPAIIFSMIWKESCYRPKVIGDNGESYGLMQIQQKWFKKQMEELGLTDLLDPYQNVKLGIHYVAELMRKGKPIEWVLMAYNGGQSYANKKFKKGEISSYATKVLEYSKTLEKRYV